MTLKIRHKLDRFLYRRGLQVNEVRRLLIYQVLVAFFLSLAFLLFLRDLWAVHFSLAAFLATLNFYILAQVIQKLVFVRQKAVLSLLLNFYARLAGLAVALYVMLIWAQFSVVAVLAGLSTILVSIMLWGAIFYIEQKEKEAQVDGS
jgi:hypothetical protein